MAFSRELIFPEREGVQGRERAFSGERGIQERGEFKSEGRSVSWVFNLGS